MAEVIHCNNISIFVVPDFIAFDFVYLRLIFHGYLYMFYILNTQVMCLARIQSNLNVKAHKVLKLYFSLQLKSFQQEHVK